MQDFTTESAVAGLIIPGHASKINEWHSDPWTQVPTLLAFCKGHISAFHMQSKKKKKHLCPRKLKYAFPFQKPGKLEQ